MYHNYIKHNIEMLSDVINSKRNGNLHQTTFKNVPLANKAVVRG